MSLEPSIVEHCAPTLARLKVASLFAVPSPHWASLLDDASRLGALLGQKGLALRLVRVGEGRALCYLYREEALARALSERDAAAFLRSLGYDPLDPQAALCTLCRRLSDADGFPHEVGVFLGYPLSDVIAFIEHRGRDCAVCGC